MRTAAPPPSPFVLRLEAEDGTITDVAVDFDFTDFTVDEHKWVIAQPPDELIPACLYVKVARQAPDLPYEMLKDALLEVTRAGRMEVIGGRP